MEEYSHEYADHWFYTPTPFEKSGGIWPIRAGKTLTKSNYKIGPRFITYYSLHFVLDGKGEFFQGGYRTQLKKGDLFCLYPKKTHQYHTDPNHCLKMFWFAFEGRQAQALLQRIGLSEHSPHVDGLISDKVKEIMVELENKFSDIKEMETLDRVSLIYSLFFHLSNEAVERNLIEEITSTNWLQKSIEYMDIHYAEGISVTDVTKYIGLHRSYFTNSFTNKVGVGPFQYLLSLKMNKASQMLKKSTNFSITEIALSLGYSDLYSFSRAFKNYYGMSPKEFKNKNKPDCS